MSLWCRGGKDASKSGGLKAINLNCLLTVTLLKVVLAGVTDVKYVRNL